MKFKVGDKVEVKPWRIDGVVLFVDEVDSMLPYLVKDKDGKDDDWFAENELEFINE
ncbi:TPA: hypothetical protein U2M59_000796 [Providencia stuartii]|nr:hypothetical protein [Providencia stuartii]